MPLFKRSRSLKEVQPGDLGYARVHASLRHPAGPAREAAIAASAAGMSEGAGTRPTRYFTYAGENGEPAAIAWIKDLTRDRPGVVEIWIGVDPVLRRFGVGGAVFELALAKARKLGATTVTSFAMHPEGIAFLSGNGFTPTQSMGVWFAPLAALAAAEDRLPAGYTVGSYADACPAELRPARARLQAQFVRDAPHGDAPEPDEHWDEARVEAWFAEHSGHGMHVSETLLLHGDEPVGFSNVITYPGAALASQRDTYVAREHRGRGLAKALKASNARAVAAAHPEITDVRTFVDLSNDPMNAVNAALGFRQREVMVQAERPIDA